MKLGARNKKSKHKDRFPHGRLTPAGDLFKLWKLGEREEVRRETEYRPLDREALKEASRALGFRGHDKEDDYTGLIGIRSPQLHKREMKGGVSSSGHNCYWFTEETLPKRRDAFTRLKEAADKGDEVAFLDVLEGIKWQEQTAVDVVCAIKLAFRAGAFKAACHIASEGVKFHPDNVDVKKYARILSPVTREAETVPVVTTDTRANRNWLKENVGKYRGQWIALRNGKLLGASRSLSTLTDEVSEKYGISFPSREVMITTAD